MRKSFQAILIILVLLLLAGYYFLSLSRPIQQGTFQLRGLAQDVLVYRDKSGVPHIVGKTKGDLFYALGFAMAGDRLFQMDVHRRLGNGELSEIFGKATLPLDIKARTMRFRAAPKEYWESLTNELGATAYGHLQDFIDGINEYMEKTELSYAFKLLKYRPRPFQVEDIFAFIGYMGFKMGTALKSDFLFSELEQVLPAEKMRLLQGDLPPVMDKSTRVKRKKVDLPAQTWADLKNLFSVRDQFFSMEGSNAWVLAPKRSLSGKALLANDPHLSFSHPTTWYEAHLKMPGGFEIYGHYLPLVPFAILGHTKHLAWGLTLSYVDEIDFFQEKISSDGLKYYDGEEWRPLQSEQQEIKVLGEKAHSLTVVRTHHGPLLDGLMAKKGIAMSWPYYLKENNTVKSLFLMGEAQNMQEFKTAVSFGGAPTLNIAYADEVGNIAAFIFGKIPLRRAGLSYERILDGQNKDHDYLGYLDFSEYPHNINPETGVIVLANYRPDKAGANITGSWGAKDRYQTIHQLLGQQYKWSIGQLKAVQTATVNHVDKKIIPLLLASLSEKLINETPNGREIKKTLENWDEKSEMDSVGASLYHFWNRAVFELLFSDLTDEQKSLMGELPVHWRLYKRILARPEHIWWDLSATEKIEGRTQILRLAFAAAIKKLTATMGDDYTQWEWGKAHQLTYIHPLGRKKYTSWLFNLGPYPMPGAFHTINNNKPKGLDNGFTVAAGPSTRRLIDFSMPDQFWGISPLGNTDHLLSPFYADQREMFQKGEYLKRWLNFNDIKKNLHATLLLKASIE